MADIIRKAYEEAAMHYSLPLLKDTELVALGDLCYSLSCRDDSFVDAELMEQRASMIYSEAMRRVKANATDLPLLTVLLPRMSQFGALEIDEEFYSLAASYINAVGRERHPSWQQEYSAVLLYSLCSHSLTDVSHWASDTIAAWRSSVDTPGWERERLSYAQLRYRQAFIPAARRTPRLEAYQKTLEAGKDPAALIQEAWETFQLLPAIAPKVADLPRLASAYITTHDVDNARRWQIYYACTNAPCC